MIAAVLALLLLAASPPATAQGAGTPPTPGAPAPSETQTLALASPQANSASPQANSASPQADSAQKLLADTLAKDIDTASYYELVTWCQQLGLDDAGSRKELQARLARHFSVTLPEVPVPGKRSVTVRSARQSEYFTEAETGEKYVLLRGDVEVEVKDQTDGTVQVIKAGSLTFNQTRRTMSAVGSVTYALTRGGQTDTFTGQSLDFNLDTSEAVFYDGSTRRVVKHAGGDLAYTFQGETITRVSNDTVILKKGSFTSSETPADPLYQIRAGTVWLLAPGEWAVQDAVLLIGRVPILYLPGFFWPGDDFFFNPNFGYQTRAGSFLQTTTYLRGHKQKEESPFSFLQLSDSGDAGYATEPHGLFLRKIPGSTPPKDDGHSLKLMLDGYSRLGVMAGLAGDYSPLGTFRTSIATTRSVFLDPTSQLYTPYLPVSNPPYTAGEQFWNSSSLFGLDVPFRYGLEGSLKTSSSISSVAADFQYFSDPSFTTDFYTRSESGLLSALFTPAGAAPATTAQLVNLSWDVTTRVDFTRMVNQPFIQNLSMPDLDVKMTWQSYSPSGLSDPQASDPGSSFYYPSSITAPNVSFAMSGDIVSLGGSPPAPGPPGAPTGSTPAPPPGPQAELGKGIRAPVPEDLPPPQPRQEAPRVPFRAPEPQADEQSQQPEQSTTFKLSYQLQPRATFEHTFDTTGWTTRQSVNYAILYRTFETGGTSSVTAAASFWDRLADTSVTFSQDGLWRYRFDPSVNELSLPDWPNLLLLDQQQDHLVFRTEFQSTLRPFPAIPELAASSLQYKINLRMYQIALTGMDPYNPVTTTSGPAWTPDAISEHSVASNLALVTPATSDSLGVTFQLPPLVPTLTSRLDASGGDFKGSVQGGFAAPTSGFEYQPLVVDASVDTGAGNPASTSPWWTPAPAQPTNTATPTGTSAPPPSTTPTPSTPGTNAPPVLLTTPTAAPATFTASEELQFDVAGSVLTRSTSEIGYAGLAGVFVAQNFETPNQLVPSTMKVGYEGAANPIYEWKDRIMIVPGLKTHWYLNFQNYVDNLFDFSPSLTFTIYKSLDITFSSLSNNTRTYLYIPGWTGLPWVNPLTDLLDSFNFANNDDRRRSGFKIQTLSLRAVQHFPDWDVIVQYQASPQLITHTNATGAQYVQNEWTPTFAIQVQWNALSEIKSNIHQDYTGTPTVPSLR
ncbi:MAG: hypothetical protein ACLQDL_03275 [Spirochaetia bacterium]